MSSALLNPLTSTNRGSSASTSWWFASARRSSAVRSPNAAESMALSAWPAVSPELRTST